MWGNDSGTSSSMNSPDVIGSEMQDVDLIWLYSPDNGHHHPSTMLHSKHKR